MNKATLGEASPPSPSRGPYRVAYLRQSEAAALAPERVLAIVRFQADTMVVRPGAAQPGEIIVPLRVHGDADVVEVWLSERPMERGSFGAVHFTRTDDILFAAIHLDNGQRPERLESDSFLAYYGLCEAARATGYPFLSRLWNFFPAIHGIEAGLERYRVFCRGRHAALVALFGDTETSLPAATAIGCGGSGVLVYGLAFCEPGLQVENPRQVSAFHYPVEYGPRSPSFSRSILKDWGAGEEHLYVSGTASIVGHTSRHARDYASQLDETLINLQGLLAAATARAGEQFRFVLLRVYSRVAPPVDMIRARIAATFGGDVPVLVLQGDICRQELLIEIEGLAIGSRRLHPGAD